MKNNLLITLLVGLLSCHYFTANALIVKRINNGLSNLNREKSSNPHQAQDLLKQIRAPSNGKTEINPVSDLPPQANGKAIGLQKQEKIPASDIQIGNKHKLLPPLAKQELTNVASSNSPSNNNPQVISNFAAPIPQAVASSNHIIESNPESQSGVSLATSNLPPTILPTNAQVIEPSRSSTPQEQQNGSVVATSNSPSAILPSNAQVIEPSRSSTPQAQESGGSLATSGLPSAILPSNNNPQGTSSGSEKDQIGLQAASKSIISPNNPNNDPLKNDPVVKSSLQNSNQKSQTPTGAAENEKPGRSFNPELFNPRNIGDTYVADNVSNQNGINSNGIAIGVSVGMICLVAALLVGYKYKKSKTNSSPAIPSNVPSIKDISLDNDPELLDVSVEFD